MLAFPTWCAITVNYSVSLFALRCPSGIAGPLEKEGKKKKKKKKKKEEEKVIKYLLIDITDYRQCHSKHYLLLFSSQTVQMCESVQLE